MTPNTIKQRAAERVEELSSNPELFGQVLDGLIEKKASDQIPAEVLRMAAEAEKVGGLSRDAALRTSFQSYVQYVNPGYLDKVAKGKLPPWLKKKDKGGDDKGKGKGFGGKKAPPFQKKQASGPMTKEAQELAKALGL
jgi:hypothetical protein